LNLENVTAKDEADPDELRFNTPTKSENAQNESTGSALNISVPQARQSQNTARQNTSMNMFNVIESPDQTDASI
jgi:hypothetical protein